MIKNRLERAINIAVDAGKILLTNYDNKITFSKKDSTRDIFSKVDLAAEDMILSRLGVDFPDDLFFAEEKDYNSRPDRNINNYWIIDALDGTVNFYVGIPYFAVSIAFILEGEPVVGVVYNPLTKELYYAAKGFGSFKNHLRCVVNNSDFESSLFSVAFSDKKSQFIDRKKEFNLFMKVNDSSLGCIRTGSASLNLAMVADGRLSGAWGFAGKFWDIAAGLVIAKESKAIVQIKNIKNDFFSKNYIAASPASFMTLEKIIKELNIYE